MSDTLPAWATEQAREALFETSPEGPTLRDGSIGFVARALVAADKAATERERDRINSMPKSWELICENEDRSDVSSDLVWKVYTVHGGLNDREWNLLGRGDTPSNAIDAAFVAAAIRNQEPINPA